MSRAVLRLAPTSLLERLAWVLRAGGLRADALAVECELLARRLEGEFCSAKGGES